MNGNTAQDAGKYLISLSPKVWSRDDLDELVFALLSDEVPPKNNYSQKNNVESAFTLLLAKESDIDPKVISKCMILFLQKPNIFPSSSYGTGMLFKDLMNRTNLTPEILEEGKKAVQNMTTDDLVLKMLLEFKWGIFEKYANESESTYEALNHAVNYSLYTFDEACFALGLELENAQRATLRSIVKTELWKVIIHPPIIEYFIKRTKSSDKEVGVKAHQALDKLLEYLPSIEKEAIIDGSGLYDILIDDSPDNQTPTKFDIEIGELE